MSKSEIRDNRSNNSTLLIDDANATLNIFDETNITNNTNGSTGAVYVKRGTVSVGDKIKINDNNLIVLIFLPINVYRFHYKWIEFYNKYFLKKDREIFL